MADTHSITCRKCGDAKPLSAFSIIKKTGKPNSYCKACRSALTRSYAEQHRDERKAYNGDYRQKNVDRLREYDRERNKDPERRAAIRRSIANWVKKNPEKRRAIDRRSNEKRRGTRNSYWLANKDRLYSHHRAWTLANPGKMLVHCKRWRDANPDKRRTQERIRRARKHGADGSHTQADIRRLLKLQRGCCAACFKPMKVYHVDHRVALARGGSNDWTNLQLLHPRCNLRKHARDPVEYMQKEHGLLL